MKKLALALFLSSALASPVFAQQAIKICVEQNDGSCTAVKSGTPLPTTGGASGAAVLGTTNGWTPKLANGLTNTAVAVKASAGTLSLATCFNPNATVAYLQVFNTASGSVTVGTTTPLQSYPMPPGINGGIVEPNPGLNFSTAISIAATTAATNGTAPGTALDCNIGYN